MGFSNEDMLWMPRSISFFEEAIVNGAILIDTNPVLRWNSSSAVVRSDETGNRKWDKRKSTGRIDGIVTSAMSAGLALSNIGEEDTIPEDYEMKVW
jgi:phage terminase large subunit-like protein